MSSDATSIQFSLFSSELQSVDASALFLRLTNSDPANYNRQASPGGVTTTATGLVDGVNYHLALQAFRLDFIATSGDPGAVQMPEPFADTAKLASEVLSRLRHARSVFAGANRLSVVLSLQEPVPDQATGFKKLIACTGLPVGYPDGSDLSVQINRRKPFKVDPTISMNRLMRFYMTGVRNIAVTQALIGLQGVGPELFFVNLQIDVNSVPEQNRTYDTDTIPVLWEELLGEALRLRDSASLAALEQV